MLSSPTISHDDEDQQSEQSDGAMVAENEKEQDTEDEDKDGEEDGDTSEDEQVEEDLKEEEVKLATVGPFKKIIYQNRDILDLGANVSSSGQFVQYTVLPENSVSFFFQNRSQYFRLSNGERQEYSLEKCLCCDFTYPSTHLTQGPLANNKSANPNAVTDSLLTFLKNSEQMTAMPNVANKRIMNNNPSCGYQVPQPPQLPQYQPNGFYNGNANNSFNGNNNYNQQMNQFMNNGSGYGSTMALLNLMNNASRNATSAFQAMSTTNNTPRYYNNNSNMNNGYGLYKQF